MLPVCGALAKLQGMNLFLLLGQSNMAGRGVVENGTLLWFTGVSALAENGEWVPALDPIHYDKPIAGAGLARSFAAVLRKTNPRREIGLIPAAVGGSSLNEWQPGQPHFETAVERARWAIQSGTLRGILWHQGEGDAGNETLAASYAARWLTMLAALRDELKAPDVPVMAGLLGEFLGPGRLHCPYAPLVNEQIASLVVKAPHVGVVPAHGLGHIGDELHFDTPALREFGRRYAHVYLSLTPHWETLQDK